MAAGDTALWLHNKLGSTDDLWSGKTICSQLNQNKLHNIQTCYHTLQPHVKVKLMLSFLHLPRRNVEQWRTDLEEILIMATQDADQWVSMIGEILKTFPSMGTLNLDLEDNGIFFDMTSDLNKAVKKAAGVRMLPLECQFLNKTALVAATGQQPQPIKHFALKRKPKSAILRAELLQKSTEVASSKKHNPSNSLPIKVRSFAKKMDDATPLKGLPNRTPPSSGFRSPGTAGPSRIGATPTTPLARPTSVRKDVGIKLLDMEELPLGAKEAKRRRKVAEMEAAEQAKKDREAAAAAEQATTNAVSYTPDYAAGLVSAAPSKLPAIQTVVPGTTPPSLGPTVSYVPQTRTNTQFTAASPLTSATRTQQARDNLQQQLEQQLGQSQIRTQSSLPVQSQNPLQPTPVTLPGQPPTGTQLLPSQNIQQPQLQTTQQPNAPKKGLSLTREQMLEAQEMFRTSNIVTRPEKALILGFMAGSRDNPCPQQGHILSIRLSETKEMVSQTDNTNKPMVADVFFQMNYQTGEWKRIKKYRECEQ